MRVLWDNIEWTIVCREVLLSAYVYLVVAANVITVYMLYILMNKFKR